jgi:hypothetical protein
MFTCMLRNMHVTCMYLHACPILREELPKENNIIDLSNDEPNKLETNKLNTIASANKDKSHNKAIAFNKPPSSKRPIFELSNLTEINNSLNLK